MKRQPLETGDYKEEWLFGDVARAWLATHQPDFERDFAYDRMMRRHWQAERRIDDGWGIAVSYWKSRPDDQSCRRCVCPRCGHELQLNQSAWAIRHENKCGLPTRAKIAGWLADAGNVFSTPPGTDRFHIHIVKRICRAFAVFQEAA